jgi:hypothetical protein
MEIQEVCRHTFAGDQDRVQRHGGERGKADGLLYPLPVCESNDPQDDETVARHFASQLVITGSGGGETELAVISRTSAGRSSRNLAKQPQLGSGNRLPCDGVANLAVHDLRKSARGCERQSQPNEECGAQNVHWLRRIEIEPTKRDRQTGGRSHCVVVRGHQRVRCEETVADLISW